MQDLEQIKEMYMKKVFFVVLFSIILLGVYGQTRPENRWILGRWVGDMSYDGDNFNCEIILNDNGTGKITITQGSESVSEDFIFSINGNIIIMIGEEILLIDIPYNIYRINDQRIVLYHSSREGNFRINLNKRN
jgi:hypothetical protein